MFYGSLRLDLDGILAKQRSRSLCAYGFCSVIFSDERFSGIALIQALMLMLFRFSCTCMPARLAAVEDEKGV